MDSSAPIRLTYSFPYNGDLELIRWATEGDDVYEVYFQGPEGLDYSDIYEGGGDAALDFSEAGIVALAELCRARGVRTNLLCNQATLFFEDTAGLQGFLERHGALIDAVTVADPYAVRWFRSRYPDIEVQASVYMMVDTPDKARTALAEGVGTICVPPSVNRRRATLEGFMALASQYDRFALKLLATHTCFDSCVFYNMHAQLPVLQRASQSGAAAPGCFGKGARIDGCTYPVRSLGDYIRRPIIRPDDVGYYEDNRLAHHIKLAFRDEPSTLLRDKLEAFRRRSYSGNLFRLIDNANRAPLTCDNDAFPADFVQTVSECDRTRCGFCERVAEASIDRVPSEAR